jgi:hypothetical protein
MHHIFNGIIMRDDQHGGSVLSVDILQQHQNISGGF